MVVLCTHIPEVPVKDLNVTMDNLERNELIITLADSANEEQRRISAVHNLGVYGR